MKEALVNPADMLEEYPELMTTKEVAELWRVTTQTIRRLVHDGHLEAFRLGASDRADVRIYKRSVIAYMTHNGSPKTAS